MFESIIAPVLLAFFTALITWMFSKRKNNQALKSMELDNEIKSAKYYQGLLDDMSKRLENAIDQLMLSEERNDKLSNQLMLSEERNKKLEQQIKEFIAVNEELIEELQKFKQLNGKSK